VRYEHLVQINDLEQPDIPLLERSQLWFGLLARAERPAIFDPGIDAMQVLERRENSLRRLLTRGASTTLETIRLSPEEWIEIRVGDGTDFAGSVLRIAIEEPAPQALFLRFLYELQGLTVPVDEGEQRALRQAYYFANLELVRQIRTIAPDVL
jgi:hypothetical protein